MSVSDETVRQLLEHEERPGRPTALNRISRAWSPSASSDAALSSRPQLARGRRRGASAHEGRWHGAVQIRLADQTVADEDVTHVLAGGVAGPVDDLAPKDPQALALAGHGEVEVARLAST